MQTSFWLTLLWFILILIMQYLSKNKMKNATNYSLENDVLINFNVDHKFHE